MAVSCQLTTMLRPKPHQTIITCKQNDCTNNSSNVKKMINFKNRIMGVAVGLLAATAVAATAPLEADATRIEYYATVSEPSCELTFVKSGLGYCDLALGYGEEVPFAKLIDVSHLLTLISTSNFKDIFLSFRVVLIEFNLI